MRTGNRFADCTAESRRVVASGASLELSLDRRQIRFPIWTIVAHEPSEMTQKETGTEPTDHCLGCPWNAEGCEI